MVLDLLSWGGAVGDVVDAGLKKARPFRFPLPKTCSFGLVHGLFLPLSVVVHLPKFRSQCEEPSENYKNQK